MSNTLKLKVRKLNRKKNQNIDSKSENMEVDRICIMEDGNEKICSFGDLENKEESGKIIDKNGVTANEELESKAECVLPVSDEKEPVKLSNYDISETIYNTGVFKFDSKDLKFWLGKNRNDFLEKYVNDANNNIKRSSNVLEMYYNGIEFNGNFKEKEEDIIVDDNGNKIGRRELSNVPLYDKQTNKKIGIAEWYCIENIVDNIKYINCSLVYFLDKKFLFLNNFLVNSNISDDSGYSTCKFDFNYISRPGCGTFFAEGDYFVSKGIYSLENGLNRNNVINNIYIPFDDDKRKRSIILHFNKIDSNNFLPQDEYGMGALGTGINMD